MYRESIEYLYGLQKFGIKFGLSNIRKLLRLLGDPQKKFRSLHIAGTNGKGSTSIFMSHILRKHGFRVGLFTSPHLVSFTERIRINNQYIDEVEVVRLTAEIRSVFDEDSFTPTFFEFVTAMAFMYFAEEGVDWAVVETGMGGRLDATNTIEPAITIITNIGIDHSEFLGKTIEEIAREKAGIIKDRTPLITATGNEDALKIIRERAKSKGAPLHIYGEHFRASLINMTERETCFTYSGETLIEDITLPVAGSYQIINASLAIRGSEILKEEIKFDPEKVREALYSASLEGRFEIISEDPVIILDGAHNPDAMSHLTDTITQVFPDREIITVAGIMHDKDARGILSCLVEISSVLILTRASYERAMSIARLRDITDDILSDTGRASPRIICTEDINTAINIAKGMSETGIILITGSFYTTGEAKEALGCPGILSGLREAK